MTVDIVLLNAKAYLNKTLVDCSLAVNGGRVFKIGKETNMPKSEVKFDLKGLLLLPGLIDAHVHLRDEGKAYKEDFYTGTAAAAAGGITTVLDMPNNNPVTMSAAAIRNRMQIAERKVAVNVGLYSEFPKDKAEIPEILKEGAIGFKLYMAEQIGGLNIQSDEAISAAFKIVASSDALTAAHAEDGQTLKRNEDKSRKMGQNDIPAFLKAHSEEVEVKAIERLLKITEPIAMHLHFCHVSTESGLKRVGEAKASGLPVTCEATPHSLLLSNEDLRKTGTLAITMPPVRDKPNIEGLWNGVKNGTIDLIGSDHAPHPLKEKEAESVWDVKVGIPGLETTLPLLLTEIHHGRITIGDLVRLMAEKPAEILKMRGKGHLKEGNDADLTIIDFKKKHKIDASKFYSKAKYSPFDGREVIGKPVKTFVAGQLVMDDGEVVAKPGSGHIIRRE